MEEKKKEQSQQEIYEELLEEYKDDKSSMVLIRAWAKREDVDWERAREVLEM